MSDGDRAVFAHRTAFALITGALSDPEEANPHAQLVELLKDETDRGMKLMDLTVALVWHAAGALVEAGGNIDAGLELLRNGALMQEQAIAKKEEKDQNNE